MLSKELGLRLLFDVRQGPGLPALSGAPMAPETMLAAAATAAAAAPPRAGPWLAALGP